MAERLTAQPVADGQPRRNGPRGLAPSRFMVTVLVAYALCRLASGIILALVAARQVPTGWTGPDVGYLTFTTQWDGQWYQLIAEHGYPRALPVDAEGNLQQNAWAFYPLFPFVTRALMSLTGLGFGVVGSTLSLALGLVAAGGIAQLLRDRIGRPATLAVVVLWASYPAAVVLQVAYTEAMAMALLTLFLLAVTRQAWWYAAGLAILLGLTRPIAVPIAAVTVVALWLRWRERGARPIATAELVGGAGALVACGVSGLIWPVSVARVTGRADAYTATMGTWRVSGTVEPFTPWLDMSRYLFGPTWGPVWLVTIFTAIAVMVLGPWASRLGLLLRTWSLAYPAYLLVVLDPFTSIFRYLIPLFPLLPILVGVAGHPRWAAWRRVAAARFWMLLLLFVVGQWYWIDVLWRFVPPTDLPP